MRRTTHIAITALVLTVSLAWSGVGSAGGFSAEQRVKILLRVLSYDRNLATRAHEGKIGVALLFSAGSASSVADKNEMKAALAAVQGITVSGLKIEVIEMPLVAPDRLQAELVAAKSGAVYICSGLDGSLPAIVKATRAAKIVSLSGAANLAQSGASVAVAEKDGKGHIVVNLPASKDEGTNFDAALLRLADVIR